MYITNPITNQEINVNNKLYKNPSQEKEKIKPRVIMNHNS